MSGKINVFLLDKLNNLIEEISIIKPKTYELLNTTLKNNLKNLPEFFNLFYFSSNNKEIEIYNDEDYQLLKDTLFIRQIEKVDLQKSIFEIAYDKLEESRKDIFDEKFNCFICTENIKHENPLFCYVCQKIFHFKCLEDWSKKMEMLNEQLKCPFCKKELPLKEWKQKLDFEENRKNEAEIINQLKRDNILKNEIFEKFKEFKIKTCKLLINILNKTNKINLLTTKKHNNNLNEYIKELSYDNIDIQIDNISNIFYNEFKTLEEYIRNKEGLKHLENKNEEINYININLNNDKKEINKQNRNEIIKNDKILIKDEDYNNINKNDNIQMNNNMQEKRNEIELVYYSKYGGAAQIFGTEFVNFNRKNIKLIINNRNKAYNIIDTFYLIEGENKIKLLIEKKLNNLSYMFYNCNSLKNITELKYLDTSDVNNFSYLFWGCSSLTDISALKSWDVSKGVDFSYAFTGCTSLSDISALEKWDVSNNTNFSYMFCRCFTLININPLNNWNVSKGKDFSNMFFGCIILSNLLPIKNWNIKNGTNFEGMFSKCKSLENLNELSKWKSNKYFENLK